MAIPNVLPEHQTPADNGNGGKPPPRGGKRRVFTWLAGILALLILLAGVTAYWALGSDRGSATLWRTAVWVMQGRLTGEIVSGNVADGLQLRGLHYHDSSTDLTVDTAAGRWHFDAAARKLTVDYLHVGNVALQLQPTPSTPTTLPRDLRLPIALDLSDVTLKKLSISEGAGSNEISNLALHGSSDRRHHNLTVDSLRTAFGGVTAKLAVDGQQPFAVNGGLALAGDYQQDHYQVVANLSGTLRQLNIALKADGGKLSGDAKIAATPFDPVPLQSALIDIAHINPKVFNPGAPLADITLQANLQPVAPASKTAQSAEGPFTVSGTITATNAIPGSIDQQRLPVQTINAAVTLTAVEQTLTQLSIRLTDHGVIDGHGAYKPGDTAQAAVGDFDLAVSGLNLHAVHSAARPTRLRGPLAVKLRGDTQQIGLTLTDPASLAATLDLLIDPKKIQVRQADLHEGKARLQFTGTLAQTGEMPYDAKGKLTNFDPAQLSAQPGAKSAAHGNINMDFAISGTVTQPARLKLLFGLRDSVYAQMPMTGNGNIEMLGQRLLASDVSLLIAGNRLNAKGGFGTPADKLTLHIDAPQLQRLGYGFSGLLQADGQLSGTLQQPSINATYRAQQLVLGAYRLDSLSGAADLQGDLRDQAKSTGNRLNLQVSARGFHSPTINLDTLEAKTSGTFDSHRLQLAAKGILHGQPLALSLNAQGKLSNTKGNLAWSGSIDQFANSGNPAIALQRPLHIDVGADHLVLGDSRLTVADAVIDLQSLRYQPDGIQSQGSIQALNIATILNLMREFGLQAPPIKTDLVLDSRWNLALGDSASGFLEIERKSGDLTVNTGDVDVALGLNALKLRADLQNTAVNLTAAVQATRIGSIDGKGTLALSRQGKVLTLTPASGLSAHVVLNVPKLETVGALLGPSAAFKGSIGAELNATGTLGQPKLSGAINGDNLAVTQFDQGIELKNGTIRIVMNENVIDLKQFEFHGGQGTLRAAGQVQLGKANPDLNATLTADHLELFASPDRRLMLSGQAKISSLADQLRIDGKFNVDHALFDLPKSSAPKLSDDVVVVRNDKKTGALPTSKEKMVRASEKPAGRFSPTIDIALDLGNDFHFKGGGAELRLIGSMNVHSAPYASLTGTGTVNVAEGTYEAFGVKLAIERGIINFQGPIDNPNINLLAMRRNQEIPAGVEVTGYANSPRIHLVSEPSVSEEEKLSWLMFGSASSSGLGQRTASSEALALLGNLGGKRIARGIGLDQFSIGSSESGITSVAGDQFVNLGKAISQKFMLGYEQSITGAESVAKVTYQLSRDWSVLMRGGTINSLNLLFNRRFD
jgi:translocation and assembly module TamB